MLKARRLLLSLRPPKHCSLTMKRLTLLLIFLLTAGLGLHAQQEADSLTRVLNTPVDSPAPPRRTAL